MKPRIRRRYGIWYCGLMVGPLIHPPYGHGHTPSEALAEWREILKARAL